MSTKRVLTILIGQTSEQIILTDLEPYDRLTIDFLYCGLTTRNLASRKGGS